MKKSIVLLSLFCLSAFCVQTKAKLTKQQIYDAHVYENFLWRQARLPSVPESMRPMLKRRAQKAVEIRKEQQEQLTKEGSKQVVASPAMEYLQAVKFAKTTAVIGKHIEAPPVKIPTKEEKEVIVEPPKKPEDIARLPKGLSLELKEQVVKKAVGTHIKSLTDSYIKGVTFENEEPVVTFKDEDLMPILQIYAEYQMPLDEEFIKPLLLQKVATFNVGSGITPEEVVRQTINRLENLQAEQQKEVVVATQEAFKKAIAHIDPEKLSEQQRTVFNYINTLTYRGNFEGTKWLMGMYPLNITTNWLQQLMEKCVSNLVPINEDLVLPLLYNKIGDIAKEQKFNIAEVWQRVIERLRKLMIKAGLIAVEPQQTQGGAAQEQQQQISTQEPPQGEQIKAEEPKAEKPQVEQPKEEQPKIEQPEVTQPQGEQVPQSQEKAKVEQLAQGAEQEKQEMTAGQQKVLDYISGLTKENIEEKSGLMGLAAAEKHIKQDWLKGLVKLCKENDIKPLDDDIVRAALEEKFEKIAEEVGSDSKPFSERAIAAIKKLMKPKK